MRSIRQLLRQPLKTLSGVLLTALAVAVLCVSFSQTLAASQTAAKLKDTFVTVALPTGMTPEAEAWVNTFVAENPDIIQADLRHGLASAYIPELAQDNLTNHLRELVHMNNNYTMEPDKPVYSGAMLEITLTGEGDDNETWYGSEIRYRPTDDGSGLATTWVPYPDGYSICLYGTVERVIGLEEGYKDPTGCNVKLYLRVADRQEYLDMGLTVGERYLVYSDSYVDLDYELRNWLMYADRITFWEDGVEVPFWYLETLTTTEVTDWGAYYSAGHGMPSDYMVQRYRCRIGDLIYTTNDGSEEFFRTVELTLENKAAIPLVETDYTMEEDGTITEHSEILEEYTYTGADGTEQTMSMEEYATRYENPTIVHLEGTAEEFLASKEGALWRQALDDLLVNNQAYPVIGVDDLHSYADFASGKASVTVGREFTDEELQSGANVCIISKSLAEANGLGIGDTISASFFTYDYANPYQSFIRDSDGIVNPTAYSFRSATMEMKDAVVYTIVGLYEQNSPWGNVDNNFFQFTPNTIFTPKSSITGDMDTSSMGMFRTFVLDGDRLYDMQIMTVEADMDSVFYYYDNGYTNLANSLKGYQQAANEILPLGLLVYGVLMALYLFLFPGRQGKDIAMMDSMGSGTARKIRHVTLSSLGILIPGSALGAAAGLGLWQYVSEGLKSLMESDIALELDPVSILVVAGLQVLLVTAATVLVGAFLAGRMNLMKRK